MAELNLKQITDKLNTEFVGEARKLVFWYDSNAEFELDIDTIELQNAKILKLQKDNQFYIKYFLEREDKVTNYLIYAPFPKPSIKETEILRQYFINHPQSIDKYTFLQNSAFTHWVKEKCSKMC